jgi:hypothetical protein
MLVITAASNLAMNRWLNHFGTDLAEGFIPMYWPKEAYSSANSSNIQPLLFHPNGYLRHEELLCIPA